MATKYEKSDFDMAALVKSAQQKRESRESARQSTPAPEQESSRSPVSVASNLESAHDGDYVQMEDGGAIVIDHEEQLAKMREADKTGKALMELVTSPDLISANEYIPDYGEDAPDNYDPGVQYINENPYDTNTKKLKDIKKNYSEFTFGVEGLVDANSEEGRLVNEALEKLRTGEVILPTPEEYEEQKKAAEERKRQRRERLSGKVQDQTTNNSQNQPTQSQVIDTKPTIPKKDDGSELEMAEMPENAIIRKGAVEQMAELMNESSVTPIKPKKSSVVVAAPQEDKDSAAEAIKAAEAALQTPVEPAVPEPEEESGMVIESPKHDSQPRENGAPDTPIVTEPTNELDEAVREEIPTELIPENKTRVKPAPIDLAGMEEELEDIKSAPRQNQEVVDAEATEKPNVTVINVPQGEANDFLKSMPLEAYDKVVQSKSIQVNKVELRDVPTATRRVESIADYRALKQRRSVNRPTELAERVLINSGIIVTLKPATSMEMSTIFKTMVDNETDWMKVYQFAFEHTVNTSIGKLSYDQFVAYVAPADVETILHGIYEISEPGERKIQVMCGIGDGGCGAPYEVKIDTSTLPSIDKLPQESKDRIAEIIKARNDIQKAKAIQMASPTMNVKVCQLDDRYLYIRPTTGHMIIERTDRLIDIQEAYGPFIVLLIMYVEKITISYQVREDVKPETMDLTDIDIICEELKTITDEDLEAIKSIIANDINDFEPVRYSLKGQFTCPNCGLTKTEIDCQISDLIFQKVQRMLE